MLSSIDGNTRLAMVLPEMSEMWRGDMCEDIEEAIREQLEASKVISDAVRDAGYQPWSDPFVRTTAYEIPLEKYPIVSFKIMETVRVCGVPLTGVWPFSFQSTLSQLPQR